MIVELTMLKSFPIDMNPPPGEEQLRLLTIVEFRTIRPSSSTLIAPPPPRPGPAPALDASGLGLVPAAPAAADPPSSDCMYFSASSDIC